MGFDAKYYAQDLLEDLKEGIQRCGNLLEQIRTYPLDEQLPNLDPIVECRNLEFGLTKLEKRLKLLCTEEEILNSKRKTAWLEEQFKKLQGERPKTYE